MTGGREIPAPGRHAPMADLEAVAARILRRAGLAGGDAEEMASILVFAQASGIDSHGLMHLPHYAAGLVRGTINARPETRVFSERASAALMDADNGPGVLAAAAAANLATGMARETGTGTVAVRNSGHFGVASAYAERMAVQGMVGLVMSNASPTVAPFGGARAVLGTNPVAVGFPRSADCPVVIDISTTAGSRARIRMAAASGEPIPPEWALDEEGRPTTDPAEALRGTMQALGGHKGTALGLMVELLSVALSGGIPATGVKPPQNLTGTGPGVSHLFVAFDARAFCGIDSVAQKVDLVARGIERVSPVDPSRPVRMPGQRAAEARQRAAVEGILVTEALAGALRRAAAIVASPASARTGA